MNDYEAQRAEKIARNKALIRDLGIQSTTGTRSSASSKERPPPSKKRKLALSDAQPVRISARIASTPIKPVYNEDEAENLTRTISRGSKQKKGSKSKSTTALATAPSPAPSSKLSPADLETLRAGWTSWEPTAPAPTRSTHNGPLYFASHPNFTPNKSPAEMLREGVFGGSYFRSLYSRRLGITIKDDWRELPPDWTEGLNVERFLTSANYNPEVNKYGVACGQSIEEWELAGWIDHQYDVRGWFQWYCRFFMGRRCEDDDRQVGRWARCSGERGRWRRALLKKYITLGIRSVFADEGADDDDEDAPDVSPVVHQTCFQWAYEVKQDDLDDFWQTGGR